MTPIVSRSNRRPLAIALVALAALVLLGAGCGETVGYTEATGDKTNGKELFIAKCGSCHTLADAGTTGTIGPNLDDAFAESRRNGLGESTFVQVVRDQIAYPIEETSTGAPGMPAEHRHRPGRDRRLDLRRERGRHRQGSCPGAHPDDTGRAGRAGAAGDAAAGKVVFTDNCGGCHTLADAGTNGTIGPNLDDSHTERRARDGAGHERPGCHALRSPRRSPQRRSPTSPRTSPASPASSRPIARSPIGNPPTWQRPRSAHGSCGRAAQLRAGVGRSRRRRRRRASQAHRSARARPPRRPARASSTSRQDGSR